MMRIQGTRAQMMTGASNIIGQISYLRSYIMGQQLSPATHSCSKKGVICSFINRQFSSGETIITAKNLCFSYLVKKPLIENANFTIRSGNKVTIMGQNGSGKSTIIKLISGALQPESGEIKTKPKLAISTAMQVMPRDMADLSVREFFKRACHGSESGLVSSITNALIKVDFAEAAEPTNIERKVSSYSGGQQSRLLLAAAFINEPDVLLLDEPTNNLDVNGIEHLKSLIQNESRTVLVISHDEEFLNSFSDTVLYLDIFSKKVEQYDGDYNAVKRDISARIARENSENARLKKAAQAKMDQSNKFAGKGGGMKKVASRMREQAEELKSELVNVRKEDTALRPFTIPCQEEVSSVLLTMDSVCVPRVTKKPVPLRAGRIELRKGIHIRITGPNGVGKTTLLEAIASGTAPGVTINSDATIGYYRQDFSTLDFDSTVLQALNESNGNRLSEQEVRKVAASFLIRGDTSGQKISSLSEGQKGLVSFASLVLMQPGILILDEPTNHINFRHLPALAKAFDEFKGALIIVSHDEEFMSSIRIDHEINLAEELKQIK